MCTLYSRIFVYPVLVKKTPHFDLKIVYYYVIEVADSESDLVQLKSNCYLHFFDLEKQSP